MADEFADLLAQDLGKLRGLIGTAVYGFIPVALSLGEMRDEGPRDAIYGLVANANRELANCARSIDDAIDELETHRRKEEGE